MLHFYLRKRRPGFELDVEFALTKGSLTGVLGPSGSGKTTVLRCLAGLERPDGGFVRSDDTWWYDAGRVWLRPQDRSVGLVFQEYALFPHLSAAANVAYAQTGRPRRAEALEWLGLVGLEPLADRYPHQLSGGQRQRVALARALARKPDLLLLDEPLSAVDEELRGELGGLIRDLQRRTGVTALLVTHSRAELAALCDEVLELRDGRLVADRYSVP